MKEPVLITGIGLVTSLGLSLDETWDALLKGSTGIRPIDGFPAEGFNTKVAAEVKGLSAKKLDIPAREERIVDTHTFMLIKCLRDAFKNSGLEASSVDRDEIAFFAGMGGVDYRVEDLLPAIKASMDKKGNLDYDKFYSGAFREIHPLWPLSMLNNIAFCQAAIGFTLRGENTVLSPHAESGAQSIYEAAVSVAEGRATAGLAAGVSEKFSPLNLARETLAGVLSADACRPFSSERDGTVLGEGCAVISLEKESSAAKGGAVPVARLSGYGEAFAWKSESAPDSESRTAAMQKALDAAELKPSDIDVLVAHGDGTLNGDGNEIEAINEIFSGCDVKVYSSKGALGHMLAGSPAVDVALATRMITEGKVPPTLGAEPSDEKINFRIITGKPLEKDIKRVMIGCTSREGHCAALVVEALR